MSAFCRQNVCCYVPQFWFFRFLCYQWPCTHWYNTEKPPPTLPDLAIQSSRIVSRFVYVTIVPQCMFVSQSNTPHHKDGAMLRSIIISRLLLVVLQQLKKDANELKAAGNWESILNIIFDQNSGRIEFGAERIHITNKQTKGRITGRFHIYKL